MAEDIWLRRTYRYRIYPTVRVRLALEAQLAFACQLCNAALEQRRYAWLGRHKSVSFSEQFRDLTDIRTASIGPAQMSCSAMRDPLRRLERAFAAFFRRVKAGEKPGYPRFRSLRRYDSLTWDSGGGAVVREGQLRLQGIGQVKVNGIAPFLHQRSSARSP